jgi:ABC-2 type transport system ATP-binding protein
VLLSLTALRRQHGQWHNGAQARPDSRLSPKAILSVRNLRKAYRDTVAVDGVSFAVAPGEIVGLLGPNGAGKTTTVNMVLGVLQPTAGSITIDGIDLERRRSAALSCTNFAAVYAALPGNLTVEQNLRVFGMLYDVPALSERIDELLHRFDLERFRGTRSGVLSSGEQTRLSLAKALLLLDEPTASIDPAIARTVRRTIRSFADQNQSAVLWTSHNMYEVEEVCHRVLFLSHGRILLEGDPRSLPREHGAVNLEDLFVQVANEQLHDTPAR